jgi:hypothetical protein
MWFNYKKANIVYINIYLYTTQAVSTPFFHYDNTYFMGSFVVYFLNRKCFL